MPLPTTRYGRFKFRQARYRRRARRGWKNGQRNPATVHLHKHTSAPWVMQVGTLQQPPRVGPAGKSFQPLLWAQLHGPYWVLEAAAYRQPPAVRIIHPPYLWDRFEGRHPSIPLIGYHVRRVQWRGRKVGKMRGRQRAIWFASLQAKFDGFFPLWDPLHRRPAGEEDAAVIGYVQGDAWKPPFPIPV